MPILAAEPSHFPDALFADETPCAPGNLQWWVMHTRPRQEKALARQLLERQLPFYLPLVSRKLVCRGRRMITHMPLFPGYVFLLADTAQRHAALTTNRIVRTLSVADQVRLWQDLKQVHQLIATGEPVIPEDRLGPGVVVEIRHGPLKGLKGTIVTRASGSRFVVTVDFIQRGASILIDDHCLSALV